MDSSVRNPHSPVQFAVDQILGQFAACYCKCTIRNVALFTPTKLVRTPLLLFAHLGDVPALNGYS